MVALALVNIFSKNGFCASFLTNFFVIYLTTFFVKNLIGTYKKMILIFSLLGILFSGIEILARPFAHNYNNSLMFFSLNFWTSSQTLPEFFISVWAGLYVTILAFIAVQFVYRYSCLMNTNVMELFDGFGGVLLMMYPILPGVIYSCVFYLFCLPDNISDSYVQ